MSIAQGTTHYNYPQVQLSDRPTFADFNPAFEDTDAKLYSLITGASTDHAAIEALQTGLGETDLLLASVKQTADSASGKADTNAENITLLQTGLGNTNRDVANRLYSVAIAEPYDPDAGTYSIGDIVVYQGQRYKCTTAVAVAEPFDADKWTGEDVQAVLDNISEDVSDVNTALTGKADTVKSGTPLTLNYNNTSGYVAAATTVYCYINLPFMLNGSYSVTVNTLNIQGIGNITIDSNVEIISKEANGFTIVSGNHSGLSAGSLKQFAANFTITLS